MDVGIVDARIAKDQIRRAVAAYDRAKDALNETIQQAFPPGTVLDIETARSMIEFRVESVGGGSHHSAGYLHGVNTRTGKRRSFYWRDVAGIVSYAHPTTQTDTGEG